MMVVSGHVYPEAERDRDRDRESDRLTEIHTAEFVFEFAVCVNNYYKRKQTYGCVFWVHCFISSFYVTV